MTKRRRWSHVGTTVSLGFVAVGLGLVPACGGSPTCEDRGYCGSGATGGAAGSSGDAGKGGKAGNSVGGSSSTSGSAGDAGSGTAGVNAGGAGEGGTGIGGSEGGAGGVPIVPPCGGDCPNDKPVCDEPNDQCVQCLESADCASGSKKKCDTATDTCKECLASTDCSAATAARCENGACVKCTSNNDCAHVAGKTVCDAAAGECVQCTGKDASTCGTDVGTGTPLVCDSLLRTCTTKKEKSSGLCQSCVSDQQCKTGQLCLKETFGTPAKDVGYFCFWKKAAGVGGAPALCSAARPYVKTLVNQTSIDGQSADACGLAVSTCTSVGQFRSKDCTTNLAPDDTKCGFAPPDDAKCAQFDTDVYRCTMTCGSDDDCPAGFPCDKSGSPWVCQL
jgi:Cys-rich repeat protein